MIAAERADPCCSDLELDQLALGELDDDSAARLRAHLAASPRCQARFAAIERVQQAWAQRAPPFVSAFAQAFAPATAKTVASAAPSPAADAAPVVDLDAVRARRRRLGVQTMAGLAAAAALLIVVRSNGPDEGVRTKGTGIAVSLTQARGGATFDVFAGDAVAVGVPVIAHVQAGPGAALAVVAEGRVVARGTTDAVGVATLAFPVVRAGDVRLAACATPLPDVVAEGDLAGCRVDTFALAVRP